ncbi:MAG: 3-deoxy-D-manno-octulosonate 8-phosphate phosphatase (KDO 8-P phosphatase) [Candidatus Paceibacteria bacterium]|jgi:3-deoxy-D-manno-octulosonate 8-phosphate phosphatase (KDO 8-P phosphatase)
MKKNLKELIDKKAENLKEFWFDVDGVMTKSGPIAMYETVNSEGGVVGFRKDEGFLNTILVPLGENGESVPYKIEQFATYDNIVAEGYMFDTRDGKCIEYLVQNGFPVYFISGRDSPVVRKRAETLGAIPVLGIMDKLPKLKELSNCSLDEILFVGDGIQDCDVLKVAGVSVAPSDACGEAIASAKAITSAKGGDGVLDEILKIFLKKKGLWPS